jgi:hypothetical protein
MRCSVRVALMASAVAIATLAAFAEPVRAESYEAALFRGHIVTSDHYRGHHRGWHRASIFHRREGYLPDHHLCFPGACRDNPYY